MFQDFEGYIDCNVYADKGIAFGHFETVELAVACRRELQGLVLGGASIRVGFGKNNHTRSRNDNNDNNGGGGFGFNVPPPSQPMYDQWGNPLLVPPPEASRALVSVGPTGQLSLLPSEGNALTGEMQQPKYVTRARPVPTITVDHKVNALGGCSYFMCNVPAPHLFPPSVTDVCNSIDACSTAESQSALLIVLRRNNLTQTIGHLMAVVAKRLRDFFNTDPHKKLMVLYCVAQVIHESNVPRAALDAFQMVVAVVSIGQCKAGLKHVSDVIRSMKRYFNHADDVDAAIWSQYEAIEAKQRADTDLASLLAKVQKK